MSDPEDERFDQRARYVGFATYCLQLAKAATNEYARTIFREMATEWLKLAENPGDNHQAS